MKTRNAFVFADFDAKKILQRPYFKAWRKKYHVDGKRTDDEIVKSIIHGGEHDLPTLEVENNILTELMNLLVGEEKSLYRLVQRHANAITGRLEKYRRAVQSKLDDDAEKKLSRVDDMSRVYIVTAARAIGDLSVAVKNRWEDSERNLQAEYRRRFGARLRQARERAGLSRKEFAAACVISMQQAYYYESGQREPSLTSLKRFSRNLGVSTDWLLE